MMDLAMLRQAARLTARSGQEHHWLREARERALNDLSIHGLPTTAEEAWRYTDLQPVSRLLGEIAVMGERSSTPTPGAMEYAGRTAVAAFVDGTYRRDLAATALPAGVSRTVLSEDPARYLAYTMAAGVTDAPSSGVGMLRTALWRDGVIIDIAPGTEVHEPIHILLASDSAEATHDLLTIRLGEGSRATVIEHHAGSADALGCAATRIRCGAGSRLEYVKVQELADGACHLATQQVQLEREASARLLHLDLGARLSRNDLDVDLAEAGASVEAYGLFFADGARHIDNHTRIDHRAPGSRSRENYRGIMDGSGRGVFNGRIIVHPGANKADAQLRNQNLLLTAGAEIDTKPELEIYADDVKCSHGATTGQLDRNAVFYLRSRGIPADQARRLLIASFAREMVTRLPPGRLLDHVVALLDNRLPGLVEAGERL